MVSNARAAVVLFCVTALVFLSIPSAHAVDSTGGIPTGQITPLLNDEGSYIDSNGQTQPIFAVWLTNMEKSASTVIYTLGPGEPKVGSQYEMSTPEAVRASVFWTAYWLAWQHTYVGQQLDYWPEQEAVQLCIWGYYDGAILSPAQIPDATVLARAQELCSAAKQALANSTPQYPLVRRRVGLSVFVLDSTATKVQIEARLFSLDYNKGLDGQPLDLSYDELQTTATTGNGGVVVREYPRRNAMVVVDVHYKGDYAPGIPWMDTNGEGLPVVTGDQFPVSFNTEMQIDPSTLTNG